MRKKQLRLVVSFHTTAGAMAAERLCGQIPNVLPLHLQEKYFDLPDQKL